MYTTPTSAFRSVTESTLPADSFDAQAALHLAATRRNAYDRQVV